MDEGTAQTAPAAAAATANNNRWSWKVKKTSLSAALQSPSPSPPSPSSSASPPPSTNSFCFTPNKSSHAKYLAELAHDSKRRKDPPQTAEMVGLSDTKRLTFYDGLPEMKLRSLFTAYEDLVQQHAIVAEEAVLGWCEAEREADDLRKQLIAEKERVEMVRLEARVEKGIMAERVERLEGRIERESGEKVARLEKLHRDEMEARMRAEARAELLQARLELVEREHEKCTMCVEVLEAVKEELVLVRCRTNNVGAMQKPEESTDRGSMDRGSTDRGSMDRGSTDRGSMDRGGGSQEDGAGDGTARTSLESSECKCARIEERDAASSDSTEAAMPLRFLDNDCDDDCDAGSSESWAVALMSQLAHIDRDRGIITGDHARGPPLAGIEEGAGSPDPTSIGCPRDHTDGASDGAGRTRESVGSICREISSMMRLARAENELNQSQLENLEMRGALTTVGRRLLEMLPPAAAAPGDDLIHGRRRSESTIRDLLAIVSKHSAPRSGPGPMTTMASEELPEVRDLRWCSPNAESTGDPSDV